MGESKIDELSERVERLEASVRELKYTTSSLSRAIFDTGAREEVRVPNVSSSSVPREELQEEPLRDTATRQAVPVQEQTIGAASALGDLSTRRSYGLPFELENLRSWEWWLNKIGIGLLLFGLAFLFKFSIDQGWLSPPVRVGFGLALGVGLLVLARS